jgi:hypothetical protein
MTDQYLIERQQQKLGLAVKEEKKKKPISIKSVKRMAEERLYKKQLKEILAENPNCEIKSPGCTKVATGLHHLQKRSPKNYRKRENLIRACNNCNLFVENNPNDPISKKVTISRFKKELECTQKNK